MSRHGPAIRAAACILALGGICAAAPAAATAAKPAGTAPAADAAHRGVAAGQPALWRVYDMIVDFRNLPRTYTCDQLWYEFHGILLRLGAPLASIDILPYDCSPSPAGDMKSPSVEVRFQLPFIVQPGITGAPLEAVERTVRLSPGTPKTLLASDCELLRQIEQTMLASMPLEVDAASFACAAPPARSGKFAVTLTLPVVAGARTVGAAGPPTAGPAPHSP